MADMQRLDRAFDVVMRSFVRSGAPPRAEDLAAALGLPREEGKRLVHELIDTKVMPMWLAPGTDSIASFAPFSAVPTPYRITIDGHQKWFGQ